MCVRQGSTALTHTYTHTYNINTDVHSTDTPILPLNTHTNLVIHHYLKRLLLSRVSPHIHTTPCSHSPLSVCLEGMFVHVFVSYKEDVFELNFFKTLHTVYRLL